VTDSPQALLPAQLPAADRLRGTQRLLVAAGLFTTLGLPVYLLFLMITAAMSSGDRASIRAMNLFLA